MITKDPYLADAVTCSKLLKEWLQPSKKYHSRDVSVDVIYWLARWVGHFGMLSKAYKES